MKIEGTQKIEAPRDRVFAALVDPAALQKCIPGCQHMEQTGENEYNAKLKAGVGPVKGIFTATVSLLDITAPEHYKLVVDGKGQPGFAKGTGEFNLTEEDGGTSIQYTGEVKVGGLLASVGQRMIQATANMLAGRFFKALEAETLEAETLDIETVDTETMDAEIIDAETMDAEALDAEASGTETLVMEMVVSETSVIEILDEEESSEKEPTTSAEN